MAVNYTPLVNDQLANGANFNGPLQQLDNAIEAMVAGTKALTSPAITSFASAAHTHQDAAGGGKLTVAAINSAAAAAGRVIASDGANGAVWSPIVNTPVGSMTAFAGQVLPAGWLWCNGANVNRIAYAALFAAISTTYGNGDFATTFGLPDLRGRAPIGVEGMGGAASAGRLPNQPGGGLSLNVSGGADVHLLDLTQIPPHNHGGGSVIRSGGAVANFAAGANQSGALTIDGSGLPHNNMPPYLTVNWIIYAGV